MFRIRFLCLMLALLCLVGVSGGVLAADVDCDATYCFSAADFSQDEPLRGICITQLPEPYTGTVMLGRRVLRSGDILTAEQMAQMTFNPVRTVVDQEASVTFLPIYDKRVAPSATVAIAIRGKEDKAPVAQDSSLETYKNLPNEGKLKAEDPEKQALTFTLVRNPRRGEVVLKEDGSFVYTPKKNKVGVDSFTYTATDPAGNVSREATVTVDILKPTDAKQYTDTVGQECRFAAEWLRNTGLFEGEKIGNQACFFPEKEMNRGQFLAMVVQALDIPLTDTSYEAVPQDTPQWLKPYMAAALRSGLTAGWPETEDGGFCPEQTVTQGEAAVMLQNALDLSISQTTLEALETGAASGEEVPDWAESSLAVLAENGIVLQADEPLTRGTAAQIFYEVNRIAATAPGMMVFRMQQ